MNYTIPKSRQQAIEIFDNLIYETINPLSNDVPTKYHMFIGALTECSSDEFVKFTTDKKCNICKAFAKRCMDMPCNVAMNTIFSRCWDE